MSASVTVGFAPAALPLIAPGVSIPAAPETDAGDPGIFAALIALLGPPAPADGATDTLALQVPDTNPIPKLDLIDLPHASEALQTDAGKSLLKELGNALIAANDALADGQPINPALEKKLRETLDDLAALLGVVTPPPPSINPVIAAAASGEGLLPAAEIAPPAPAIPLPDLPDAETPPVGPPAEIVPSLTAAPPIGTPETSASITSTADVTAEIAPPAATDAPAPVPPITQLAKLIEDLGNRLVQQAPELAQKLDALAQKLASSDLPDDVLARLGLAVDAGQSDTDLTKLVETLAAPSLKPVKDTPAPAFQVPALKLPETSTASPGAVKAGVPTSTEAPAAVTADPVADAATDATKAVLATHIAKDTKPAAPEPKAAAPAATTAPAAAAAPGNDAASTPDAATPATQLAIAPAVAGARAIHAAYQSPVQQLNLPQVAFEVARQVQAGNSRFQIRLDPPELGRIDVRLDVDKHGTVNARMTVERPETLDLMQRDQRALQQALQQAGLDGSKTSLEFSLRQNPFARDGNGGGGSQPGLGPFGDASATEAAADASPVNLYRGTASAGGVNLFV